MLFNNHTFLQVLFIMLVFPDPSRVGAVNLTPSWLTRPFSTQHRSQKVPSPPTIRRRPVTAIGLRPQTQFGNLIHTLEWHATSNHCPDKREVFHASATKTVQGKVLIQMGKEGDQITKVDDRVIKDLAQHHGLTYAQEALFPGYNIHIRKLEEICRAQGLPDIRALVYNVIMTEFTLVGKVYVYNKDPSGYTSALRDIPRQTQVTELYIVDLEHVKPRVIWRRAAERFDTNSNNGQEECVAGNADGDAQGAHEVRWDALSEEECDFFDPVVVSYGGDEEIRTAECSETGAEFSRYPGGWNSFILSTEDMLNAAYRGEEKAQIAECSDAGPRSSGYSGDMYDFLERHGGEGIINYDSHHGGHELKEGTRRASPHTPSRH